MSEPARGTLEDLVTFLSRRRALVAFSVVSTFLTVRENVGDISPPQMFVDGDGAYQFLPDASPLTTSKLDVITESLAQDIHTQLARAGKKVDNLPEDGPVRTSLRAIDDLRCGFGLKKLAL
ncbi:MAG: hypothetical protein EB059_09445 [Alphaproteobacteria bacterium]|nr:hypothetical protein [Alphaproteobacteria bacterium]